METIKCEGDTLRLSARGKFMKMLTKKNNEDDECDVKDDDDGDDNDDNND